MAKSALTQLQEQIEAVRREAFAAGYAAAMQSIRDVASQPAPGAAPVAPARRAGGVPPRRHEPRRREPRRRAGRARSVPPPGRRSGPAERRTSSRGAAPMRGSSKRCYNRMRRAPCAPPRSAARCSATRAWRWRLPRSAMRSASWKGATPPSRSPTARPGAIAVIAAPPRADSLLPQFVRHPRESGGPRQPSKTLGSGFPLSRE